MQPNKTFIIRHKETKEVFEARSGKTSWKATGHAKNAFNQSIFRSTCENYGMSMVDDPSYYDKSRKRTPRFDEQDVFEIVELKHEGEDKLQRAVALLKELQGRVDSVGFDMIWDFLQEIEND